MKKILFILSAVVLLNACGGNKTENTANATKDSVVSKDFKEVYGEFFSSIIDDNSKAFNSYIHPEYGLYIIEATNGTPIFQKISDISYFRSSSEKKSIFDINKTKIGVQMIEEELPLVNCDSAGFYTKRGCYTQEVNTFKDEKAWAATSLSKEEKDQVNKVAQTIVKTIINTANYRYYFSKIEDKWYITFIDMRKPCNG